MTTLNSHLVDIVLSRPLNISLWHVGQAPKARAFQDLHQGMSSKVSVKEIDNLSLDEDRDFIDVLVISGATPENISGALRSAKKSLVKICLVMSDDISRHDIEAVELLNWQRVFAMAAPSSTEQAMRGISTVINKTLAEVLQLSYVDDLAWLDRMME